MYLSVKDLVELLEKVDQRLPVGRTDHYGDFVPMDENDFSVDNKKRDKWLAINPPWIGPEPD